MGGPIVSSRRKVKSDYAVGIPTCRGDDESVDLRLAGGYGGVCRPPQQRDIAYPSISSVVVVHVQGLYVERGVPYILD